MSDGIHSCSIYCQRPLCVMRRERDTWQLRVNEAGERIEQLQRERDEALGSTETWIRIATERMLLAEKYLKIIEDAECPREKECIPSLKKHMGEIPDYFNVYGRQRTCDCFKSEATND